MAQATHADIALQNLTAPRWECVNTSQQVRFQDERLAYVAKIEAANAGLAENEQQEPLRIILNADRSILETQIRIETFTDEDGDELQIDDIDQLTDEILMRWLDNQIAEADGHEMSNDDVN